MARAAFLFLALIFCFHTTQATWFCLRTNNKRVRIINPPTLFDPVPFGFSHIAVDTKNFVAHVAGQVAINQTGAIIGDTLAEQLVETERNLLFALDAVEADISDITRVNAFILNFDPRTDLSTFMMTGKRLGSPVTTLISTGALAIEGLLVEIELDAVVSRSFVRRLICQ
ncbi:hypothetical protein BWQ96_00858 [Gracilariopsis chorda]|uniref:Uncharacterized protein n=1 Tax=Gracilariopsis chorda TaxID=448386 RepID=A0A2V3J4H8_9FLOR|nr:hypothetical protein BWQ96_00858 [Gracilariopsis chorda]|eukprot:PXF49284.1 hypothetical protein BWQ96_00858 [Gracilariopsis chorda]